MFEKKKTCLSLSLAHTYYSCDRQQAQQATSISDSSQCMKVNAVDFRVPYQKGKMLCCDFLRPFVRL